MQRVFWVTCPDCRHDYMVDYGLRHTDVPLECPMCRSKFAVSEAAAIDDR